MYKMEFNLCTVLKNDTISGQYFWPSLASVYILLSKSLFMFFVTVVVVLLGRVLRQKKITKLSDLVDIAFVKTVKGIPSVSMLTILKCLYLYRTDMRKSAETIFAKYGEVVQFNFLGLYNFVFITNPSVLQKIYMSTEHGHLYKPDWYNKMIVGAMEGGMVSAAPDTWKKHRSIISKVFTYNGLVRQLNIIEEHTKRFVLNLQETSTPCLNKPVISFDGQVNIVTLEIISHIAVGKEMEDVSYDEKTSFHANFARAADLVSYRFRHPVNLINFVWKLNPLKQEMDRVMDELSSFMKKVMSRMRKQFDARAIDGLNLSDDMDGKSIVEVMMKAGFSNDEIFTEMATFLAAGHETTSNTFKFLLYRLAKDKEYQDKCRKEINDMFDQMCTSKCHEISMEHLNSLTFLDMCIKETLRKYPVIPLFGRVLKSPVQLDKNTYLPSNTLVVTSPWIIQHNPRIYPEPEKFDPERFLPENVKKREICAYMPFSAGPRNCIGFKSATIELKVLAAYVLHNFEVRSEKSIDDLNEALRVKLWPFPDLDIKLHPILK